MGSHLADDGNSTAARLCRHPEARPRRRLVLLGGLAASVAGLVPVAVAEPAVKSITSGKIGGIGGAMVPPGQVSLADYGGVPGAGSATLVGAFSKAFAALAKLGGGTLLVPAGLYDFGSHADPTSIILCRNLRDIVISAYGATFIATTTANVVPHLFYFFNFENVTIAGASFIDPGFTPWTNWRGMYGAGIQADKASCGFRMIDCFAERVVGLFASNNNAATRHHLRCISIHGEVHDSYYGAGASFISEDVNIDLVCHNVRRAVIAYSLRLANIVVAASSTAHWPGSNGLVALVAGGESMGNVEKVRVKVDVSGESVYSSYVHFYHQGPEAQGYMRDIDATVNVISADSHTNLFEFDHEANGVQRQTARVWDRIWLHGSVRGKFMGRTVSNSSVTTSPGTVFVDRNLAGTQNKQGLSAGFRINAR